MDADVYVLAVTHNGLTLYEGPDYVQDRGAICVTLPDGVTAGDRLTVCVMPTTRSRKPADGR